jgi:hypothetical protein
MVQQIRAVLDTYRVKGGVAEEVGIEHAAHGLPVEVPDQVAAAIVARLQR